MEIPLWVSILAIAVPALVSIASAVVAAVFAGRAQRAEHSQARLRDLEQRVAQKKVELYTPIVTLLGRILAPSGREKAEAEMEEVLVGFQSTIVMWASDEVIEAFFRFRAAASSNPPSKVTVRLVSDFLIAVRRDVAWPDTEVDGLQVVGMRINDLDKDPSIAAALTMPLGDVFAANDWKPSVPMRAVGRLEAP